MSREYYDTADKPWPACRGCEHCDGEKSSLVRNDYLRGHVCPVCDSVLDEMYRECAKAAPLPATPACMLPVDHEGPHQSVSEDNVLSTWSWECMSQAQEKKP